MHIQLFSNTSYIGLLWFEHSIFAPRKVEITFKYHHKLLNYINYELISMLFLVMNDKYAYIIITNNIINRYNKNAGCRLVLGQI